MATDEVWSMVVGSYSDNFSHSTDQKAETRTEEEVGSNPKALLKVLCLPARPMSAMAHNLQTPLAGDQVSKRKSQQDMIHSNHNI